MTTGLWAPLATTTASLLAADLRKEVGIDFGAGAEFDAEPLDPLGFAVQHVGRQALARDDLAQLAADFTVRLIDGDRMPHQAQLPGGRQDRRGRRR